MREDILTAQKIFQTPPSFIDLVKMRSFILLVNTVTICRYRWFAVLYVEHNGIDSNFENKFITTTTTTTYVGGQIRIMI